LIAAAEVDYVWPMKSASCSCLRFRSTLPSRRRKQGERRHRL